MIFYSLSYLRQAAQLIFIQTQSKAPYLHSMLRLLLFIEKRQGFLPVSMSVL